MDYKSSGVDIDKADEFVERILPACKSTYTPNVLHGVGPFASLYALTGVREPVLVASTDGVGTKLKIAIELGRYDTIGQDLVGMCVNDLVCCGARPLFFLDYFAVGKLKPDAHARIIEGIARACKECGCSLVGGETAEMPGLYHGDDFDLAGFAVGVVERSQIIDGSKIAAGDVIIGIASSGLHSNGYSLVRKIVGDAELKWDQRVPGDDRTLGEITLEPTKLYSNLVASFFINCELRKTKDEEPACRQARRGTLARRSPDGCRDEGGRDEIRGIAHITGGGLVGNVPRILPDNCQAVIKMDSWPRPAIFKFLQEKGRVAEDEMRRVFNLGIGLVIVVAKGAKELIVKKIAELGERAWVIGEIGKVQSSKSKVSAKGACPPVMWRISASGRQMKSKIQMSNLSFKL